MKKELLIPIAVAGLTIAFGVVCCMVYFSRGSKFICWNMKLGGLLLMLTGATNGASGQEYERHCNHGSTRPINYRPYIGPIAGVELVSSSSHFTTPQTPPFGEVSLGGSGTGFYGGARMEYLLGEDLKYSNTSLNLSLTYRLLPSTYSSEVGNEAYLSERIENFNSYKSPVLYNQTATFHGIDLSPTFKWNPIMGNGLNIEIGFSIGYYYYRFLEEDLELTDENPDIIFKENPDYTLLNDRKYIEWSDTHLENYHPWRIGLVAGWI
jgi:hypothetical protein